MPWLSIDCSSLVSQFILVVRSDEQMDFSGSYALLSICSFKNRSKATDSVAFDGVDKSGTAPAASNPQCVKVPILFLNPSFCLRCNLPAEIEHSFTKLLDVHARIAVVGLAVQGSTCFAL